MPIIPLGILSAAGAGGGGVKYWLALFGGSGQYSNVGAVDSSDNIILTGAGNSGVDAQLVKYDTNGSLLWQKLLASATSDSFNAAGVDSSGNIYAAGLSSVSGTLGGNAEWIIAKYNSSGTIQWQRGYSNDAGNFRDQSEYIAVDSSGNSYAVGYTSDSSTRDSTIAKWDSSGTFQWQREINQTTTNDLFYGVTIDSSGNIYATGYCPDAGFSTILPFLTKWDSSGTLQWQRRLGEYGAGEAVGCDSSGNVYVVGSFYSNADVHIAKYNSSGTIQWQRRLASANSEYGTDCVVSADGDIYLVGASDNSGTNDIILAKYNASGTIQWQRRIKTTGYELGTGIRLDSLGNLIVFGWTDVTGGVASLIAKLPPDGSLTGTYSLGGSSFVYEAGTLTDSSTSYTVSTPTFSSRDPGFTEGSRSLTDSTSSVSSTTLFI